MLGVKRIQELPGERNVVTFLTSSTCRVWLTEFPRIHREMRLSSKRTPAKSRTSLLATAFFSSSLVKNRVDFQFDLELAWSPWSWQCRPASTTEGGATVASQDTAARRFLSQLPHEAFLEPYVSGTFTSVDIARGRTFGPQAKEHCEQAAGDLPHRQRQQSRPGPSLDTQRVRIPSARSSQPNRGSGASAVRAEL